MCDNPLLYDGSTFQDSHFNGSGSLLSDEYKKARITNEGWCPTGAGSAFLLIDLQKEYHITQVVVMADKEQKMWSSSYSMEYGHDVSYGNIRLVLLNYYFLKVTIVDITKPCFL